MKKYLSAILKKKYLIVIVIFLFFFIFIDENGALTSIKLQNQLTQLKKRQEYYTAEIQKDSIGIIKLRKDFDWIEKYGRENYYMKRDNEDIFIITRSKD